MRGTSRSQVGAASIREAGLEAAVADPNRIATVLDQIEGVAVIHWLLGGATGEPMSVRALHGDRLERLLGELVDTPVRGLVYEGAGSVDDGALKTGTRILREASERWRIPVETVTTNPSDRQRWRDAMLVATGRVLGLD